MSAFEGGEEFRNLESELHSLVERELADRSRDLAAAGLSVELLPVGRTDAEPEGYSSYVEATVIGPDGIPADVLFFHVVLHGRIQVDAAEVEGWLTRALDDLVASRPKQHEMDSSPGEDFASSVESLRSLGARLQLGRTTPEDVVRWAEVELGRGGDAPALVELAGLPRSSGSREVNALLGEVLNQLGVVIPDTSQAVMTLAAEIARDVLAGDKNPREGAEAIWTLDSDLGDFRREVKPQEMLLHPFIYAASEWRSRPEDAELWERAIRDASEALISEVMPSPPRAEDAASSDSKSRRREAIAMKVAERRFREIKGEASRILDELAVSSDNRQSLAMRESEALFGPYIDRVRAAAPSAERWPGNRVDFVDQWLSEARARLQDERVVWFLNRGEIVIGVEVPLMPLLTGATGHLVSRSADLMAATPGLEDGVCLELNQAGRDEEYWLITWGRFARIGDDLDSGPQ